MKERKAEENKVILLTEEIVKLSKEKFGSATKIDEGSARLDLGFPNSQFLLQLMGEAGGRMKQLSQGRVPNLFINLRFQPRKLFFPERAIISLNLYEVQRSDSSDARRGVILELNCGQGRMSTIKEKVIGTENREDTQHTIVPEELEIFKKALRLAKNPRVQA